MGKVSSRRDLLLAAAAAALAAGCGDDKDDQEEELDTGEGDRVAGGVDDVKVLKGSYERELEAIALCDLALEELRGDEREAVTTIRDHERRHAKELKRAIDELGGTPPTAAETYELLGANALDGLATNEGRTIAANIEVLPTLSSSDLRRLFATIIASDAEHLSVLEGFRGRPRALAFVPGGNA